MLDRCETQPSPTTLGAVLWKDKAKPVSRECQPLTASVSVDSVQNIKGTFQAYSVSSNVSSRHKNHKAY